MNHKNRYRYEMLDRFGGWSHNYLIVTRWGAIHFHVSEYSPEQQASSEALSEPSAGLECHYRQPPEHMADEAPSHDECWAIKAPCWHDGTSLYATETLLPMWKMRTSEAEVFLWLESETDRFDVFEPLPSTEGSE